MGQMGLHLGLQQLVKRGDGRFPMLLVKSSFWYFGWLRYFLAMSKHWVAPNRFQIYWLIIILPIQYIADYLHPLRLYVHKMAGWWLDSQVVTATIFAKSHPHPQECIPVRQVISSLYLQYISSQGDAPSYGNMDVLGSNINPHTLMRGTLYIPLKWLVLFVSSHSIPILAGYHQYPQ